MNALVVFAFAVVVFVVPPFTALTLPAPLLAALTLTVSRASS